MRTGRPKATIKLSETDRAELETITRSRSLPHGLVRRASVILASIDGMDYRELRARFHVSNTAISSWRRRYQDRGLAGLYGEDRPGRPRHHSDEAVAEMIQTVLRSTPKGATHWSVRLVAEETGISKSTVQRYFTLFGLQPHRRRSFKLSTDPLFVDKVRDIVGLYLNPPDKALVLCVDEKSQIQALERTQPVLPMGLGYLEGVTHDYYRHGTTTLFAALDVANGKVITQCKSRHRHQEFLSFLRHIDEQVPPHLDIHLIVDNYATHKHPKVRGWLAKHTRFHMHFTPTYASWLNQVERWFGLITQRAIKRASTRNVKQLIALIRQFVDHYNLHASPFMWTATADSILSKIDRLCKVIYGTGH
jgi:transposase